VIDIGVSFQKGFMAQAGMSSSKARGECPPEIVRRMRAYRGSAPKRKGA